jgi:hypothetical protein
MAGAAARHEQGRPLHPSKPHVRILEPVLTADLDTLLTALYVELTDRIIPFRGPPPRPQRREAAAPVPELAPTARRGRHH